MWLDGVEVRVNGTFNMYLEINTLEQVQATEIRTPRPRNLPETNADCLSSPTFLNALCSVSERL
jgi:hypothetical protein